MQTLGSALSHGLKARGVEVIFGIPGVHNIELYRGIEEAGLIHVLARHEQGAGYMADGYARATGKPGVAYIITGPGLTNIMTPMGQAYSDSIPMLVISSCLPDHVGDMPGRLHQMRDQIGAAATVCEWSEAALSAETAFQQINHALEGFQSKRNRPVHLSIPIDVLGTPLDFEPDLPVQQTLAGANPDEIAHLCTQLAQATHPLFIFGGGAVDGYEHARTAIEKSGAAAFSTFAGRGVIDGDHPLNFGAYLSRPESASILAKADLLVVVGSELADVEFWRNTLGHTCPMVRIDIDPEVHADVHVADQSILADAGQVMAQISAELPQQASKWQASEVADARVRFAVECDSERPGVAAFCRAMKEALPDDTMYYSDMTQFAYVAKEILPMSRPGHWHHPFGFGTLGYALPAAIGGKIARPNLPTVAILGDYGFQYTMQELGVAAELGLTLPIILWDNGKLKEIEDCMINNQIAPNAVVAQNPDFSLLAAAYGVHYQRPGSIEAFQRCLQDALTADGPTIIHLTPDVA